ncbi:MAG: heavy-metal-associated domain-containing protein [Acidobacteria bacterium]|jgi:copper chaperone|nr:heavy-metal-associated domain-containing protein [Acidobacteriota bacterium]
MENQTNKTTVVAPDIVCGGCAGAIKNALGKVGGISQVEVDVDTKTVSVEHNNEVSRQKIVEVLDDAGFPTD